MPSLVRERLTSAIAHGAAITTSSLVVFELWYGVAKSARSEVNARRLHTFLTGPVDVLDFDDADAEAAGTIRAALEAAGTPIGAYDTLIAGQATRRGMTLVTANTREFSRVDRLAWEDWAHAEG